MEVKLVTQCFRGKWGSSKKKKERLRVDIDAGSTQHRNNANGRVNNNFKPEIASSLVA